MWSIVFASACCSPMHRPKGCRMRPPSSSSSSLSSSMDSVQQRFQCFFSTSSSSSSSNCVGCWRRRYSLWIDSRPASGARRFVVVVEGWMEVGKTGERRRRWDTDPEAAGVRWNPESGKRIAVGLNCGNHCQLNGSFICAACIALSAVGCGGCPARVLWSLAEWLRWSLLTTVFDRSMLVFDDDSIWWWSYVIVLISSSFLLVLDNCGPLWWSKAIGLRLLTWLVLAYWS